MTTFKYIEVACNYEQFLLQIRSFSDKTIRNFSIFDPDAQTSAHDYVQTRLYDDQKNELNMLLYGRKDVVFIGYNIQACALPLTKMLIDGADVETLRAAYELRVNDSSLRDNAYERNSLDLINIVPDRIPLELACARAFIKCPIIQDNISLLYYLYHRLDTIIELFKLLNQLTQTRDYFVNLYNKTELYGYTNNKLTEFVIANELRYVENNKRQPVLQEYSYIAPSYIKFESKQLNELFNTVTSVKYLLNEKGTLKGTKDKIVVTVDNRNYNIGLAGLHSCEKNVALMCKQDRIIREYDVTSFYPSIIINNGLFPQLIGKDFLIVYKNLVEKRIVAKRLGNMAEADALKLVINSIFGKFLTNYSRLYAPECFLNVVLTGQLVLLMLIERLTSAKISVLSANTDSVIVECSKSDYLILDKLIDNWCKQTNLQVAQKDYDYVFIKDVNNVLKINKQYLDQNKDSFCGTGVFALYNSFYNSHYRMLQKNNNNLAVVSWIMMIMAYGLSLNDIEHELANYLFYGMRVWLTTQYVPGGAQQGDVYVGQVLQYYHSKTSNLAPITDVSSGEVIKGTENCKAVINIDYNNDHDNWYTDECLRDIDVSWYEKAIYQTLEKFNIIGKLL
jgi:hypothetical protein